MGEPCNKRLTFVPAKVMNVLRVVTKAHRLSQASEVMTYRVSKRCRCLQTEYVSPHQLLSGNNCCRLNLLLLCQSVYCILFKSVPLILGPGHRRFSAVVLIDVG